MNYILNQILNITLTILKDLSIFVTKFTFNIRTGYYLKLLTPKTMELLGSTEKNSKNVPHLEINEIIKAHCNAVNIDYQQDLRNLYIFAPSKLFCQLLKVSPKNFIFLKTFNWFTGQNSKPLKIRTN